MTSLKTLTFTQLPKLTAADPVIQRRNKLIARLKDQIELVKDPNFILTRQKWVADEAGTKNLVELRKRVRAWWRTDATGAVVLKVLYGSRAIEFAPGKAAIAIGKKERLVPTIETVIAAVEAGELDAVLAQMSKTAVMTKAKRAA
jgi:hypothetical protein